MLTAVIILIYIANGIDYVEKVSSGINYNFHLYANDNIWSLDENVRFTMQSDGNAVLYKRNNNLSLWNQIWSTHSNSGNNSIFAIQSDGNLAIYDSNDEPVWASYSMEDGLNKPYTFLVSNDENAYLLTNTMDIIWITNTTQSPTSQPTTSPTSLPTVSPTIYPTLSPTKYPTIYPTLLPTEYPTIYPIVSPTKYPSNIPTTEHPTLSPTAYCVLHCSVVFGIFHDIRCEMYTNNTLLENTLILEKQYLNNNELIIDYIFSITSTHDTMNPSSAGIMIFNFKNSICDYFYVAIQPKTNMVVLERKFNENKQLINSSELIDTFSLNIFYKMRIIINAANDTFTIFINDIQYISYIETDKVILNNIVNTTISGYIGITNINSNTYSKSLFVSGTEFEPNNNNNKIYEYSLCSSNIPTSTTISTNNPTPIPTQKPLLVIIDQTTVITDKNTVVNTTEMIILKDNEDDYASFGYVFYSGIGIITFCIYCFCVLIIIKYIQTNIKNETEMNELHNTKGIRPNLTSNVAVESSSHPAKGQYIKNDGIDIVELQIDNNINNVIINDMNKVSSHIIQQTEETEEGNDGCIIFDDDENNNTPDTNDTDTPQDDDEYIDDQQMEHNQIYQWLHHNVELLEYYNNFIENGYESLQFIEEIENINELNEIGIVNQEHQIKIISEITKLKKYGIITVQ